MKNRPVIELRVRYGRSVVLQMDSDRLFYVCIYGGMTSDPDGWSTLVEGSPSDPNFRVEARAIREIPANQRRTRMRKLRRILSSPKPKTDKV